MIVVDCVIYPVHVLVSFDKDEKQLIKKASKHLPKESIEEMKEMSFHSGKAILFPHNKMVLWQRGKPKSIEDLAVLNHEIFHITCFILERVGLPLSKKSDEAYAYLLQYLTKEIYKTLGIRFKK